MIDKVVFVGYQPLTKKIREDFYLQELVENNFGVEYWDLSEIFFKTKSEDIYIDPMVVKFTTLKEFEKKIRLINIESTLFHLTITYEYRVTRLYRILSKYKCKTSFFGRGVQPVFSKKKSGSIFFEIYSNLKDKISLVFVKNVFAFFLKKFGIVNHYTLVFKSGFDGIKAVGVGNRIDNKKSKIIEVNSFDFEEFKIKKQNARIIQKKYCVYLDEYLPFHPDFELFNLPTVDQSIFYDKLNAFFTRIEFNFNIHVVIAAHPKASKYKEYNFFEGRDIFFNKSMELTRHAEFVLFHCSSSVNFAVLNNKTILSLNARIFEQFMPIQHGTINAFSEELGTKIIYFDENFDKTSQLLKPNRNKYKEYVYRYLTSLDSAAFLTSEVYINAIKNYL